jgi:hypothetical protein
MLFFHSVASVKSALNVTLYENVLPSFPPHPSKKINSGSDQDSADGHKICILID